MGDGLQSGTLGEQNEEEGDLLKEREGIGFIELDQMVESSDTCDPHKSMWKCYLLDVNGRR